MQIYANFLLTLQKTTGSMEMPRLAYNLIYRTQELRNKVGLEVLKTYLV